MKNTEFSTDLFIWGIIKNNACTQVSVSSTLGSPVQMLRHMNTSHTHLPWWQRLQLTCFTFQLPHEEGQLQKIKWHVEIGSCSEPTLHTYTGFLWFNFPHYQTPYFPKQLEAKPLKMLREKPWKELTPNEQSGLFPHVDKPSVNRCFLSSHLAVVSRDD